MNDDLISRNAFLKRMKRTNRYFDVKFDIMEEPAVDAVEVVRCAQCKHFKRNLENDTYCSSENGLTDPQEDDFCSYGERKEGADNEPCYCKNENMADCRKCYWRNICIRHNPIECSHFKKEYGD